MISGRETRIGTPGVSAEDHSRSARAVAWGAIRVASTRAWLANRSRTQGEAAVIPEIFRYRISLEQAEAFVLAYAEAGQSLQQSPHCKGYELLRSRKDPELFLLIIRWDSPEGHLQGFRQSAQSKSSSLTYDRT